jgi:hypothetical protein
MAIRKSRERDVFVFFYPGKCLDVVALYIRLEPSCCLPVSLLALGGRLFPLTKQQNKKTTSE